MHQTIDQGESLLNLLPVVADLANKYKQGIEMGVQC